MTEQLDLFSDALKTPVAQQNKPSQCDLTEKRVEGRVNLFKIDLPLYVMIPRKTMKDKKIALNLNIYRNLNFIVNNQAKVLFKELLENDLVGVRFPDEIQIDYKVFYPTKRMADVANVCCVVDKFFCDTLVGCKVIPDDNYKYLKKVSYEFGGIDKNNARVEATVRKI